MKYRVLLLGSGGREHALAWKLAQGNRLEKLFIAPGNPGTATIGENVAIAATGFEALKRFTLEQKINLIVVGPEEPLVNGIADFFADDEATDKIPVIGPCKRGAQLEGSKDFAKNFMQRHGIPTARFRTVTAGTIAAGEQFLDELQAPYVLKADGLAAGKGVLIIHSRDEAKQQLRNMLQGMFGAASSKVVIEEFLQGIELSVFILTDGKNYKLLPEAKDYKRVGDNDTGTNTGGMGAVSPVPFATPGFLQKVEQQIIQPTIAGLQQEGITYKGFLFFGLMNVNGAPYVIEYNVRLGDPETEVVLPRLQSDLLDLFEGVAQQTLGTKTCAIAPATAVAVMCVSGGYPGTYGKGYPITGLQDVKGSTVFHAGTAQQQDTPVTAGGRVLAVTSLAESLPAAREKTYAAVAAIHFQDMYFRRDIGVDCLHEEDGRRDDFNKPQ
ncbi:MAG: phosphoribosylamine--glycine ligase [Prevotellaceae bacterium]|jgi:phosphoribosylamine--glycine ligase|nr:phosphoribosylamine--glycine ligase [Prevotellaceae bacterium]